MKVILKQDIKKLGKLGDTIEVAGGYARNYLLPRDLAWPAEAKYEKRITELRARREAELAQLKEAAEAVKEKIEALSVTIEVEVGEEDKLFGSVTSMDIEKKIADAGIEVDKKDIVLEEPIKKLGVYKVAVKLHPEVEAVCKVWVVKK